MDQSGPCANVVPQDDIKAASLPPGETSGAAVWVERTFMGALIFYKDVKEHCVFRIDWVVGNETNEVRSMSIWYQWGIPRCRSSNH